MPDRRVLAANSLYHLTNDASVSVLPALFPVVRTALGFGYEEVGLITAASLLVTVVLQVAFGALADRVGPKVLLPLAIAWLGGGMALVALATSYASLFLFVAVMRVGASAYHPVGVSWISREYRGARVDAGMGVQSSFGDLGVLLGLFPAGFLALALGWQGVFLFWAAVNGVAAVAGFLATAKVSVHLPEPRPRVAPLAILRSLAPWLGPLAAGGAVFTITTTFGPLLLTDAHGVPDAWAPAAVGLWIVAGAAVAFAFGRIAARFGRYNVLQYGFLAIAVGGVMIANGDLATAMLGLVAFNALLFATYPALFAFASDAADVRSQGLAYGVFFGFLLVGGAVAAYAAGALSEALMDVAVTFRVMAAIALASFAYLFVLRAARSRGRAGAPS